MKLFTTELRRLVAFLCVCMFGLEGRVGGGGGGRAHLCVCVCV